MERIPNCRAASSLCIWPCLTVWSSGRCSPPRRDANSSDPLCSSSDGDIKSKIPCKAAEGPSKKRRYFHGLCVHSLQCRHRGRAIKLECACLLHLATPASFAPCHHPISPHSPSITPSLLPSLSLPLSISTLHLFPLCPHPLSSHSLPSPVMILDPSGTTTFPEFDNPDYAYTLDDAYYEVSLAQCLSVLLPFCRSSLR
jgi:hypothetical protein